MNEAEVVRLWNERNRPHPAGALPEGVSARTWIEDMATRPEFIEAMAKIEREAAEKERRAKVVRRFCRAMRRHEKRARLRCREGDDAAKCIAEWRVAVCAWMRTMGGLGPYDGSSCPFIATNLRDAGARTEAFLHERGADAVEKLRSALAEIGGGA